MISRYTYKKITWLDILNPTPEEIREVAGEANLPPELATDLTAMVPHTETEYTKGVLKITLDFPIVKRTDINHPQEIKFLVTKTHLVTIHFEEIEAMDRFTKKFEVLEVLQKNKTALTPISLFLMMLNYLYEGLYLKLEYLETRLEDIEDEIFKEHEKEMVFELSQVGRRLIAFKRALIAHHNAIEHLSAGITTAFNKNYANEIMEIKHRYHSVLRQEEALSNVLIDLRETNGALLNTKQNETMKMFTILAFMTFPLTLFSSLFGMNTVSTPIVGMHHDFWIIVGIMFIVSFGFFIYFKYRRWI